MLFVLNAGQPEEVETLVDTLTMEGATLNEAQLSALSHCDLQQLAELSQELHLSNEMGNQSKLIHTICHCND